MDKQLFYPPGSYHGNNIIDFNHVRINDIEQEDLLIKASIGEIFDNELQIKSRDDWEINGKIYPSKRLQFIHRDARPIGYCKSTDCKMKYMNTIVHSVDFGTNVYYHCLKCLS